MREQQLCTPGTNNAQCGRDRRGGGSGDTVLFRGVAVTSGESD